MSDPDRHLSPELIEKSAQALHDMRSRRSWAFHEIGQPLGDTVCDDERRADARAALEAAAPMIAAKALRDEADRLEGMAYGCTGRYTDAGRHIIARIRDRADALEAGAVR